MMQEIIRSAMQLTLIVCIGTSYLYAENTPTAAEVTAVEKFIEKKAASIIVSKDELEKKLAKIKGQFPSEEDFRTEVKKSGLSIEQFTENLSRSIRQQKWIDSHANITIREEEAKTFYESNIKDFAHPDLVKASHILFRTPENAKPDQLKAAEAKAKAAIVRANTGEDFGMLAGELSEEPGAAQRGGDLGFFTKDKMVPEFASAAFAQESGTVSATPVKTKFGFHVIKVTDKKPAGTATFEEAKNQIGEFLRTKKQRQFLKSLVNEKGEIKDSEPTQRECKNISVNWKSATSFKEPPLG